MYLDAFTLSALVDEFLDTLVGGRVQDTLNTDPKGLGLEIYANRERRYLYLSADQHTPRVHLVGDKLRRGVEKPSQVGLLFRRYVEGGRVMHVSQPAWERVMVIDIEGPEGDVEIVIEPMERRSNILLLQNGVILDCMRRVGPGENRHRLSLPAHQYMPPPPQVGKRDPLELSAADLFGFFDQTTDPKRKAFQVLTGQVLGMSPLLAREIIYRAEGEANQRAADSDPERVFAALREVVEPLAKRQWQPGVAEDEHGLAHAFSVYPLEHIDGWHAVGSISGALSAYYGEPVGDDAYNAAKQPVFAAIEDARDRLRGRLLSLEAGMTDDSQRETLRQSGELILAYQYMLEDGQTELRAHYDPELPELVIPLDPGLTPLENAQRYFTRYNKAKRALDDVPRLIDETRTEMAYLDQLASDLEMARNWPDIDDVVQALQSGGYWLGKQVKRIGGGGQSAPIRITTPDGFVIWVGRNSRQNEIVTFKKATGSDLWLHARDVPGAHVIIKFDGRRIPDEVIEQAAAIAAHYSSLRGEGRAPVDVTRCKYVKKIKGAGQGMVTYRNEETLLVTPRPESDFDSA